MTAPIELTELDEQTREELRPPCDGRKPTRCENLAEWAIAVRCVCSMTTTWFACQPHFETVSRILCTPNWQHRGCGADGFRPEIVSVVRL